MSPAPYIITASVVAAALAWTLYLATGPDPLTVAPGLTVGLGLVIFAVIDAAGLLLSRGRWARRLGAGLAASGAALFVLTEIEGLGIVALALSAFSAIGLAGPWLDGWIRKRPAAGGPGPGAMTVALGTLALVPVAGLASPSDLTVWHGVLGAAGGLLAWAYARARVWSLWTVRLGLPLIAAPAAVSSPWPGAVLIVVVVVAVMVAAWTGEALLAVQPLLDRLPGPRIGRPRGEGAGNA